MQILLAEEWSGSDNQSGATGPHYRVHYQGWKKTWDEWVPETRLLKHNEENLARQRALVDAHKAEAAVAAAAASAAAEHGAHRGRDTRRHAGASSSRGSKRSRESTESDADAGERRPEIHLVLPDVLKAQLVDDWENVTRKDQLVPLPRHPNVREIIAEYEAYYSANRGSSAERLRTPAVVREVLAGLKLYFDKSLAQNLLYRFERPQYVEVRKQRSPLVGEGGVPTKPAQRGRGAGQAAEDPDAAMRLEASEVYGAEHLLRLFGASLSCSTSC